MNYFQKKLKTIKALLDLTQDNNVALERELIAKDEEIIKMKKENLKLSVENKRLIAKLGNVVCSIHEKKSPGSASKKPKTPGNKKSKGNPESPAGAIEMPQNWREPSKYQCALCKVRCNSPTQLEKHLKGLVHNTNKNGGCPFFKKGTCKFGDKCRFLHME